ncbi:hypothetical protein Efla_001754 [Eimeria flavescens]
MAQRDGGAAVVGLARASFTDRGSFQASSQPVGLLAQEAEESALFCEAEGQPESQPDEDGEAVESTFKILIATDTHLGFKEEDPVRGNDSFRTFEEVLQIGRREEVDFVLHGGDLFDENKPSRTTLYRAMCLLRKYCFGSGKIQFDVLSSVPFGTNDAAQPSSNGKARDSLAPLVAGETGGSFEPASARSNTQAATNTDSTPPAAQGNATDVFRFGLNYLNENVNVCMPVFAMHGNHDDPGDASHLSPLDILEAAHLINYFGRVDNVEDIHIRPILLRKGSSKVQGFSCLWPHQQSPAASLRQLLAIYGMGWVRDERLHRAYASGKVTYEVPADGDVQSWFNVLLVHQNMYKGGHGSATAKNCLLERMLPSFADMVIWGHEHDCHTELRQSREGRCQVLQPGSSIATSLTAGEAQQKHVFILEVEAALTGLRDSQMGWGDCFRLRAVPLQTVRPLIVEDVSLADVCQGTSTSRRGATPTAPTDPREAAADREAWGALTSLVEDILRRYSQTAGVDLTANALLPVTQQHQQQKSAPQPRRRQAYQLFCNYRAGATQDLVSAPTVSAGGPLAEVITAKRSAEILQRLPLVRIRVEHTGFSTISAPRFASQFVGKVANPDSLLCFYRKRQTHYAQSAESSALPELEFEDVPGAAPSHIHDIIFHYMEGATGLSVLSEPDFNDAVQDFAVKMDPSAISKFVADSVSAARLHARSELLKRLKADSVAQQTAEEVRIIISVRIQSAAHFLRAHCLPHVQIKTSLSATSSPPQAILQDESAVHALSSAEEACAGETEASDATRNDFSAVHRVSTANERKCLALEPRRRVPLSVSAADDLEVLQVSDGEAEGLDGDFAGAPSGAFPQKPSRRGAGRKPSTGGRPARGRAPAKTQTKKVSTDVISSSESQEEGAKTRETSAPRGVPASASSRGGKQQKDIRSLLSQLTGKRGLHPQLTACTRPGSDPPYVPTQESEGTSTSQTQCASSIESSSISTAQRRPLPSKGHLPARPALPLRTPHDGAQSSGDVGAPLGSLRASQARSWTKRARLNESQQGGEAGLDDFEFATLQSSLFTGANDQVIPQRPERRTIGWKRR